MRPLLLVVAASLLACASGNRQLRRDWQSEQHREHPLVGRIWDVKEGAFTSEGALHEVLGRTDLVLLGEVHDNPDHHRLQAELVREASRGRHPAIAFEMLDASVQAKVDGAGASPEAIAEAVEWEKSGWPEFALYRPIFEAAQKAELKIVAANLSRQDARAVVKQGLSALTPELRSAVERHWPPDPAVLTALRAEMQSSHCGQLPETLLEPMVLAQTARDVYLAHRLAEAAGPDGAILIAGNGHVRSTGVPAVLAASAPAQSVVTVGLLEVDPAALTPAEVAARTGGTLPFDYVIFTPAKQRPDPCEGQF